MEASQARWWAVRVLYEQTIGTAPPDMVQDSIFVVLAEGEREAATKGSAFASGANHEYLNPFGEMVRVRFDQVTDVHEIGESGLADGTEVYMSLEAGSDAESLRERGRMRPKPAN
jgi:hypothetical protein